MLPLPRFDYLRPNSLKEALHLLSKARREAKVLAGGTDVFVQMKKGLTRPRLLVDIKSISQLHRIGLSSKGELVLGAGVTLAELEHWARRRKEWFGLSIAAGSIGSAQVRNRATVVGNLCRASPAGDMAPMLASLDATVEMNGPRGKRSVLAENFVVGPGQTILTPGEMVTSLKIPKPPLHTGVTYLKLGARRAMEIAVVSIAVRMTWDKRSNKIRCARIVLGAVAAVPIRILEAEAILMKHGVNPEVLEEISHMAAAQSQPITDLRGTRSYRSEMVKVLTKRAVEQVWREATG